MSIEAFKTQYVLLYYQTGWLSIYSTWGFSLLHVSHAIHKGFYARVFGFQCP